MNRKELEKTVHRAVARQTATDLHTHCFSPRFGSVSQSGGPGGLMSWGIDELLTYHYLVAEVFRAVPTSVFPYEKFWALSRAQQADHIWQNLFVERTPISEACRGVLTTLSSLGLDPNEKTLKPYRKWFGRQDPDKYVDKVMELANIDCITMTNSVFEDEERVMWETPGCAPGCAPGSPGVRDPGHLTGDPRFETVLRLDTFLCDWPAACAKLRGLRGGGYDARPDFSGNTAAEVRRFLEYWLDRMKVVYVAMSLPPEFRYPRNYTLDAQGSLIPGAAKPAPEDRFLREAFMPVLAERRLPWAMMIGPRRGTNPGLRGGGDMMGRADVLSVANLCRDFPANKFMCTMLSRENQHELCAAARKFGNLMIFGCWWYLNVPSMIEELTRMRLELLGTSFVPQHSDARIIDQLIYKWGHSRTIIAKVLSDKYADLAATGFKVTAKQIERDAALLLRDNYRNFLKA